MPEIPIIAIRKAFGIEMECVLSQRCYRIKCEDEFDADQQDLMFINTRPAIFDISFSSGVLHVYGSGIIRKVQPEYGGGITYTIDIIEEPNESIRVGRTFR